MINHYLYIREDRTWNWSDGVFLGIATLKTDDRVSEYCLDMAEKMRHSNFGNYDHLSKEQREELAKRWEAAVNLPEGKYEYYFNLDSKQEIFKISVKELAKTLGIDYELIIKNEKDMTQEENKQLLEDLCGRLSHGVICKTSNGNGHLCSINQTIFGVEYGINIKATERDYFNDKEEIIKPYLRPMSSMTEKEKWELKEYLDAEEVDCNGFGYSEGGTLEDYISSMPYSICVGVADWLNKKMFDYRGLIPKDLAIEVTEDNNPYK